jgi:hypothetical protein
MSVGMLGSMFEDQALKGTKLASAIEKGEQQRPIRSPTA